MTRLRRVSMERRADGARGRLPQQTPVQQRTNMPALPAAKKAIGYFRPPSGAGDRERALREQEQAFRFFCSRGGYEPAGLFAEADGATPATSAVFRSLLDQVRDLGGAVTVVVPSVDALGHRRDEAALVVLEMEDAGARVHTIGGAALDPVRIMSAPWTPGGHGKDVGERIKSAMRSRAIRGEGLGKPPYGYRIGSAKKLDVHPEEAETVRLIYTLYTQKNLGIRLIVRHLNEHKIPTRKGRNWSMVTIRDILRNRAYLGTYTRFGMRVPGSHPAIITPDMFRWAQTRLNERKPQRKNGQAEPFLLSGLVYCGYCNNRMVGVTRKQSWTRRRDGSRAEKQYRYYQCQSRTNQSVCQYHTHRASELEASVQEYLQAQRDRLASIQTMPAPSATSREKERQRLAAARRGIERKLRTLLQQAALGALPQQRWRPQSAELLGTRRELDARLARREQEPAGHQNGTVPNHAAAAVDRLAREDKTLDFQTKRDLLHELVTSATVFDDRVEVKLQAG